MDQASYLKGNGRFENWHHQYLKVDIILIGSDVDWLIYPALFWSHWKHQMRLMIWFWFKVGRRWDHPVWNLIWMTVCWRQCRYHLIQWLGMLWYSGVNWKGEKIFLRRSFNFRSRMTQVVTTYQEHKMRLISYIHFTIKLCFGP